MSIRIGIYEFFARIIPGGLYLFTIIYLSVLFGLVTIDFQSLNTLSPMVILVFAILAYILGLILDQFAVWWHRLFKPKNYSKAVLNEFKKRHADWELKVEDKDWPILLAHLRHENLEVTTQIETHNTTYILLRNVSLNFAIMSVIQIAQFFQTSYIWNLVLSIALVVMSTISGRQAKKFRMYYYSAILEAIIARRLELSEVATKQRDLALKKVKKVEMQSSDKQLVQKAK